MRQGRTVALEEHAKTHIGAREVAPQLAAFYANDPRVQVTGIDNSRGRGNAAESPLADLPASDYTGKALCNSHGRKTRRPYRRSGLRWNS
jgi:hypothetical protein